MFTEIELEEKNQLILRFIFTPGVNALQTVKIRKIFIPG